MLALRSGTVRKERRTRGTGRRKARRLLGRLGLADGGLGLPIRRLVVRHWRPSACLPVGVAIIALLVLASEPLPAGKQGLAAHAGSLRLWEPGGALAVPLEEAPGPRPRDQSEAGVRKKRTPDIVALQWNPTPQPPPDSQPSDPSPSAQMLDPSSAAALPRVAVPTGGPVAAPTAPGGVIVGLATWYGGVDGYGPEDLMADGSYFDPNDPTIAAANDWPLGTWLQVCYLERCIEVQVRDRGAFSHALDLSYAAFSRLAPPSTGLITVTISKLP